MARLTFPSLADIERRVDSGAPRLHVLDAHTTAERLPHGPLAIHLTDPGHGRAECVINGRDGRMASISIMPVSGSETVNVGPVTLPEPIVARVNRLLSEAGATPALTLYRDWHTKTHGLRVGPRKVRMLTDERWVVAMYGPGGWYLSGAVAAGTPAAPSVVAPAPAPAPAAPVAAPPTPAPAPAPVRIIPAPAAPEMTRDEYAEPETPATVTLAPDAQHSDLPPAYAGEIVLDKRVRAEWQAARAVHRAGQPMVVGIIGPSGAGKTHAVHALSAEEGLDVVKFDASGVIEPSDWFGTVALDGDGTRFVPSDLLTALTAPGARVLLLDEMNRANLRALNALLPVLDGSGSVTVPQTGQRAKVNPAVMVALTANIGSQYLGAEPLDEAIRTRIGAWIEMDHLDLSTEAGLLTRRVPGLHEDDAGRLADLAHKVREAAANGAGHPPVSTRQLLATARLIVAGLPPRAAVESAILGGYLSEGGARSERAKVKTHVTGIEWDAPKSTRTPLTDGDGAVIGTLVQR